MNDIRYGRKRKGIRRELHTKVEEWLKSISDDNVRKHAKRDVIVTGGCIASMLLGEEVNDYDIYFRTKETALEVEKYYVDQFTFEEGGKATVDTETIYNIKGQAEDRVIIRIPSEGVAEAPESKDEYRPVFLSQNAITLTGDIQLIVRFYGEPDRIHDNYDFVHATCYYDHSNSKLEMPSEALQCLLSRSLVYRGSLYPIASIFRMKKFLDRGWRITAGEQLKICWQISELDLTDYDVIREQLTGVDVSYMDELVDSLRDVSSDRIDSSYVASIIDKIFD